MKKGWEAKTLDELCTIARGGSPRPIKAFITEDPSGINWIKISDATASTKYIYKSKQKIKPDGIKRSRLVKPGDFLLSNSMSFGRPYIMRTTGCIHDGWLVLSDKSELFDQDYLYYFLGSHNAYQQFDSRAAGSTVRNLNIDLVRTVTVPLPPLPEQKRIVAVLDEAFEAIAVATANAGKNITNARELFESYLNDIFTQKGEGWVEKTLKEVSLDFGRGKSKHRPRNDPKLYGGPYPFIQTGDVRNSEHFITISSQTYSEEGLGQSKLWPKGTICITIAANIAETGILDFDACFPDSIIGIVVDEALTTNGYVEYALQAVKARLKARGQGSAQDNINLATFESEFFPFPSLGHQKGIMLKLDKLSAEIRRLEIIYQQKLDALAELKQSLLQKAFAGELSAEILDVQHVAAVNAVELETTSPAFSANVLAFTYSRHASGQRDKTFGRVKAQKGLHLTESIGGVDLGRQPIKDAAGPNDSAHMRRAENWAKAEHFFEFVPRPNGRGYDFKKLYRYDELITKALIATKPFQEQLGKVVDLILPMNSRQAELLATVHAAWNNLILDDAEITDETIILEARENWHHDKLKIPKSEFKAAIKLIRDKEIIPNGTAKRVGGQEILI